MKTIILFFSIIALFIFKPYSGVTQINVQDSLALVNFYDSTNGNNWNNNDRWKTSNPVRSWHGVQVTGNRVTGIQIAGNNISGILPFSFGNLTGLTSLLLIDNKISGNLPSSFGNLINLKYLNLGANPFTGDIPASLGNLVNLKSLSLYSNFLSGSIPAALGNLDSLSVLDVQFSQLSGTIPMELIGDSSFGLYITGNRFTFKDIEPFAAVVNNINNFYNDRHHYNFDYDLQADIHVSQQKGKLYVSPGGTLNNDTLRWYKAGSGLVATIIGDTTFMPGSAGDYFVNVTNSVATQLTLNSDTVAFGFYLADTTITVTQNISGTSSVDINSGFIKLLTLTPSANANALAGSVTSIVTIDSAVSTFNNQPYVQRHYDIIPQSNGSNAEATVTLYFTQQDFDNFNAYVTSHNLTIPLLPVNGTDNGNLRVTQFHGTFTGSSNPANYSQDTAIITPGVLWDNTNNWWIVTFNVSGFSGFYITTGSFGLPLPLTLLSFDGVVEKNTINLYWFGSGDLNTKQIIIQRSNNSVFTDIGEIAAQSFEGVRKYNFADVHPLPGVNFYRLKMINNNGDFVYSDIIQMNFTGVVERLKIYPNPVLSIINIKITSHKKGAIILNLTDALGKLLKHKKISADIGTTSVMFNIEGLSAGTYYLNASVDGTSEKMSFIKK